MDPREMEALIQRLVANPGDGEALAYAHQAGTQDPRAYAILLEKVGMATPTPAVAAHWLGEAANVWSQTLGDAHHAARTLMAAIERDPTQRSAAERLASLYREKGDQRALVALLERRVKALAPLEGEPDARAQLVEAHEELGKLWGEPPLLRPERAVENYRRLVELDPRHVYGIYALRELLKAQQQYGEALPFFAMEHALVDDPERRLALYRDEADLRRRIDDWAGAAQALRNALSMRPDDPALSQELGLLLLEQLDASRGGDAERNEAAQIFVRLAESYDGEYAYSYSASALRAQPGHDRAMQLADYWGKQQGRLQELKPLYTAYLQANPNGFMAGEARKVVGSVPPPPPPPRAPMPSAGRHDPTPLAPGVVPLVQPAHAAAPQAAQVAPQAPAQSAPQAAAPSAPQAAAPPPVSASELGQLLEEAQADAQKGRKPQALQKFREVLKLDPAHSEALAWVEEQLRQKRQYGELRDVLFAAARVSSVPVDTRKAQLREVAGICESQLRDIENAVQAWKLVCQIDRGDDQAREQLRRLLEKGARWDDLANVLEQDAMQAPDVEQKIALEKKLAQLQEGKRKDPAAAAEAWARIAALSPGDESVVQTAVKLFEKAERFDLAGQVIADNLSGMDDPPQRAALLQKLGELRLKISDPGGAGDALSEAAEILATAKAWEQTEKAYVAAERWTEAATALERRAELDSGKGQAALYSSASELLLRAGDTAGAIERLEKAAEVDPANDGYAERLERLLRHASRESDLVTYFLSRAEKLQDKQRRVAARRAASELQRALGDREGARESLLLVLSDGDDEASLRLLVEDAADRGDHQDRVDLLRRLGALVTDPQEKLRLALDEAGMFAEVLDDVDAAIERYEQIVKSLDPKSTAALRAIADLYDRKDDPKGAAEALERELALTEGEGRVELAQRLAQYYEGRLDDPKSAVRVLDVVHAADPEDFDAVARLLVLVERLEDWARVAKLSAALIEVEGDEEEAARMTLRLAGVLGEKLGRGDEALAALERLADEGNQACRDAYVELGDKLGWKGIVATKLVSWFESSGGPKRVEALRSAFDRFVEVGRDPDACRVAVELARSRGADRALGEQLEAIAVRARDLDALGVAHEILSKEHSGAERASELVRQAEVLVSAGVDPLEAIQHGEGGLPSVPPGEVEPFLARLAALTPAPGHVIDLYERQVGRCRNPADRLPALARAAQVAAERGSTERAKGFFEIALAGGVQEDTIVALAAAARAGDEVVGGNKLRGLLAEALAAGGQGSRDGGRTRSALLRRAATLAHDDLGDADRAFQWLGDAVVAHVDDASLDALVQMARAVSDLGRAEKVLGRALEEVFDGPLVRRLLSRRARLRRDDLRDLKGAAVDLKKLHDLSPSDVDVMNELSQLLTSLGDHRGMIQLYEDQILRGRDPAARAELARKVAKLWEEELGDAREAADAWRRVLRMKAGDAEATAGLERAKTGKLKRAEPRATPPELLDAPTDRTAEDLPPGVAPAAPQPGASALAPASPAQVPAAVVSSPIEPSPVEQGSTLAAAVVAGAVIASATSSAPVDATPPAPAVEARDTSPALPDSAAPLSAPDTAPHAQPAEAYGDGAPPRAAAAQAPPPFPGFDPQPVAPLSDARPAAEAQAQPAYAPPEQVATAPGPAEPGYSQGYAEPGYAQPGYAQPGYAQPGYAEPGYAQPGYAQPGYAQPGQAQAAPAVDYGYPQGGHEAQQAAYPSYPQGEQAQAYPQQQAYADDPYAAYGGYEGYVQQYVKHYGQPPPGYVPPQAPAVDEVDEVDDAELLEDDDAK